MARILLIEPDKEQATRIEAFLRLEKHDVIRCNILEAREALEQSLSSRDVAILDVTTDNREIRLALAQIRKYRTHDGPAPMILCISRVKHGPRFELELEKWGARLVYVC